MNFLAKVVLATAVAVPVYAIAPANANPYSGVYTITQVGTSASNAASKLVAEANSRCYYGFRYLSEVLYDFEPGGVSATATIACTSASGVIQ